ncbi:hypothetical protein KBC75_02605 [Candidatus Shapirobacteria bacterium]|nr:hypothetical protein [Candidatus Shapirobacteria bacterium]
MTYSNINWDKAQVFGVGVLAGVVIISALGNINKQYWTIKEARQKESDLQETVVELKTENNVLKQQLEYATSSAAINRRLRGEMGVGTQDDYWIELPPEAKTFTK